jgi:hypothetical protein
VTSKKRMTAKLHAVRTELRRRMHLPIPEQGKWLAAVVRGHLNYYAVPGNSDAINAFRDQVIRHWHKTLRRRGQRHRITRKRLREHARRWLPAARITRPWPEKRLTPSPRHEPSALDAHAGICAGSARERSLGVEERERRACSPPSRGSGRRFSGGLRSCNAQDH